ncbi:hypothetical protein [Mucilaginibacter paludis]|uniref:Uncharacterized protein n=1 Tax=Mucilaginibacter paludis DSM 18603 TaxID=714943 RepID=H1YBF1_9SPHI|nr:hypothetical protein [Mucilaginibacter paludis]EHQ31205.1 hypothetical protein Mucpa_7162 [Mucilaginibacter paludis DSM 18603]
MDDDKKHYHFVNSQTGNVIAYLSVPASASAESLDVILDKRRKELAVEHGLYFEIIYWKLERKK